MAANFSSIAPAKRLELLDIIRGFALLGILFANIWHHRKPPEDNDLARWTGAIVRFLFDGSSWPLFAMLFGIGFAIWMDKAMKKENSIARFAWRLVVLFLITMVFYTFIENRPILFLYAIMGLPLILFAKSQLKTLLIWALVLYIYSEAHPHIIKKLEEAQTTAQTNPTQIVPQQAADQLTEWEIAMKKKDYLKISKIRFLQIKKVVLELYRNTWIYSILSCFLLGLWAWKKKLFQQYEINNRFWKKLCVWGGTIGLLGNLITMLLWYLNWKKILIIHPSIFLSVFEHVTNLALSFFYAAFITILWNKNKTESNVLFNSFKSTGKIALTNYFLQYSLVVFIFYNYCFGLDEKLYGYYLFLVGIGIYIFQVIFSLLWLKRFEYGPLEWLWRTLTYFKFQQMKKINKKKT
jgi:uncharacterized protein